MPPAMDTSRHALALLGVVLLLVLELAHGLHGVRRGNTSQHESPHLHDLRLLYLHTLRTSLTGSLLETPGVRPALGNQPLVIVPFSDARRLGADWPQYGLTMVGELRLQNIQELWTHVISSQIMGDYAECGVWRGGAAIFARGVLRAYHETTRIVHVVDSFQGLPKATSGEDIDAWSTTPFLSVSLAQVQAAFQRAGLLDAQVQFHKGYFRYSLPLLRSQLLAQGRELAILRMDGDMYESTMDQLFMLYDLVVVDGFVIIDDYVVVECKRAIHQFLLMHNVLNVTNIKEVDGNAAYFRKTVNVVLNSSWYLHYNSSRGLEK